MTMTGSPELPTALYTAEQVRALDRSAIEQFAIPGLELMLRAGRAAFRLLQQQWPDAQAITVLCGSGNNGGDGYVVARLALEAGLSVRLLQLGDPERLKGDALTCAEAFLQAGGKRTPYESLEPATDLIVDGLLGTGLEREVAGAWAEAVNAVNEHPAPVLSLDIPSGLHADSGRVMGCAIRAAATISFIGLKRGMFSGEGPACCGDIAFDDLQVPTALYQQIRPTAECIQWSNFSGQLRPRPRTQHKGGSGHLLVVGGDVGTAGAIRMAAEAAARTGAGLVSIATRREHAGLIASQRPELMCHGVESGADLSPLLKRADAVAVGPGLGQAVWGRMLLRCLLESALPLVLDADALNLLAKEHASRPNWVLTPHPGEAGRLLGCSASEVQSDRFEAVTRLQRQFGGVILLKGAGTLITGPSGAPIEVCTEGNPGMASGGMGDVLTGVIGGLIVQGEPLERAAAMGACLHGEAADRAAAAGERGMLASDLMPFLRQLMNPEATGC